MFLSLNFKNGFKFVWSYLSKAAKFSSKNAIMRSNWNDEALVVILKWKYQDKNKLNKYWNIKLTLLTKLLTCFMLLEKFLPPT